MLNIDYCEDESFWDVDNERSISLSQAVKEGYFKSYREAKAYYDAISSDDYEEDEK